MKISEITKSYPWELALLVMIIFLSVTVREFASTGNLANILTQIAPIMLLAVGQSFILLTGGIDLSQGAVVGVTSVLLFILAQSVGLLPALFITIIVCVIYYFIASILVTVPKGGFNPFIVTLSTMYILNGIVLYATGGTPLTEMGENMRAQMEFINSDSLFRIPNYFWIVLVLLLTAYIFLHRTSAGILIYAVGDNPTAAKAQGLSLLGGRAWAYITNGVLTSVAGFLLTCRIYQGNPHLGEGLLFESIGGAVLGGVSLAGGVGGVWFAVRGILLIFLIQNALYLTDLNSNVRDIAVGLLILMGFILSQKKRS